MTHETLPSEESRPLQEDEQDGDFKRVSSGPPDCQAKSIIKRQIFGQRILAALYDSLFILSTVPYFTLLIATINVNGHEIKTAQWETIKRLMTIGVSITPIVYAALIGRASYTMAEWKLERGISFGTLEQLIGSTSLFRALGTIWTIRRMDLLALILVLLWCFSPIGGQATLRVLEVRPFQITEPTHVRYLNLSSLNTITDAGDSGTSSYASLAPLVNSMYISSISAPSRSRTSTIDIWGNVKIPFLEDLEPPHDGTGFRRVPQDKNISYSSLIGLPIQIESSERVKNFTMESYYFSLDCSEFKPSETVRPSNPPVGPCENKNTTFCTPTNFHTDGIGFASYTMAIDSEGFFDGKPYGRFPTEPQFSIRNRKPSIRRILYQSFGLADRYTNESITARFSFCNLTVSYVHSQVSCTLRNCTVQAMRPSNEPLLPSWITPFDFELVWSKFEKGLHFAPGLPRSTSQFSLNEAYIRSPDVLLPHRYISSESDEITPRLLSRRLGQLLNTYWLASSNTYEPTLNMESNGTSTFTVQRYVLNIGWFIALLIGTIIMFAAALGTLIFNQLLMGPANSLNLTSTLTQDHPDFQDLKVGSALDGAERLKLLSSVRVRLGDVMPESDIGRVAINLQSEDIGKFLKGRTYY